MFPARGSFLLFIGVLGAVMAAPVAAEEGVASYGEALADYTERRRAEPSPLTAADRQVMARAAESLARSMPDPGLDVGDTAPDFALPNASGETVRLGDLLDRGPVVLVFYRGAWCPYCNLHLKALHQSLPAIRAQGAHLVAVTPQLPDRSRVQVKEDGYPFEILSDLDDRVMKAYGLLFEVPPELRELYRQRLGLDLADFNGPGRYVLPVPGTYVIAADGTIAAAFAQTDYRQRMEPAAIVAALRRLGGGT